MKLDPHISFLLYRHECVIVPGFGGFVGQMKPSSVHPVQQLFLPPSRVLAFNRNLTRNDGLLSNRVSQAEKLSYTQAQLFITEAVRNWFQTLEKEKRLPLEMIGVLFFDPEKNLCFEPDLSRNYLPASFGLAPVQAFPILRSDPKKVITIEKKAVPKKIAAQKPGKFSWMRAAAVGIILLGIGEMAWVTFYSGIPMFTAVQESSMFPIPDSSHPAMPPSGHENQNPPSILPSGRWSFKHNDSDHKNPDTLAKMDVPIPAIPEEETVNSLHSSETGEHKSPETQIGDFLVVAGCFSIPENAEKLLSGLLEKGYPATIAGKTRKGLTIVSYQSFSGYEEAKAFLSKVKTEEDSASWILAR